MVPADGAVVDDNVLRAIERPSESAAGRIDGPVRGGGGDEEGESGKRTQAHSATAFHCRQKRGVSLCL